MIIVVTGIPRSGTSMMMRMLETGGVPCLYKQVRDEFNPDGYYEHPDTMIGKLDVVPEGYAVKCLHFLPLVSPDANVKAIIMRRDIRTAWESSHKMADRVGVPRLGEQSVGMFYGLMDSIRCWCADKPHIEVWYDDLKRNTANEVMRVAKFLGLPLDNRLADMANIVEGRSY